METNFANQPALLDDSIINIVFVNISSIQSLLIYCSLKYNQKDQYMFIYGGDDVVTCYEQYERMLHQIHPMVKFRLFCLLDRNVDSQVIKRNLLHYNQYHNRYKLKCFLMDDLNLRVKDKSSKSSKLLNFESLRFAASLNHEIPNWFEFLDVYRKQSDTFPYVDLVWNRLVTLINQNHIINYPQPDHTDTENLFHLVFVGSELEASFWTKLNHEVGHLTNLFVVPGHVFVDESIASGYYDFMYSIMKLKPLAQMNWFCLFDCSKTGQKFYQWFIQFNDLNNGYTHQIYNYTTLDINLKGYGQLTEVTTMYKAVGWEYPVIHQYQPFVDHGLCHSVTQSSCKSMNRGNEQDYQTNKQIIWSHFIDLVQANLRK